MENISKTQIACLVLGYLKQGNYKVSYKAFYGNCQYLAKFRERKLKVSTRLHGLTLVQILQEYNELCSIVLPRLEETDYYDRRGFPHKEAISEQLLYLLNYGKRSGCSTPVTSVCSPTHRENESYTSSNNILNSSDQQEVNDSEIFKHPQIYNDPDETEHDESSSAGEAEKGISEVVEAFKESLLAREELQEKIAHTINEVRCETLSSSEVEAAIKDVINRTEIDPAFEDLIDEILGVHDSFDNHKKSSQSTKSTILPETPLATIQNETIDSSVKNVIVINSSGVVNSQTVPAGAFTQSSGGLNLSGQGEGQQGYVLSTEDIMTMPIVVCDDKNAEKVMIDEGIQVPEKRLKTLVPRKDPVKTTNEEIKAAEGLADFFSTYYCNNDQAQASGSTEVPPGVKAVAITTNSGQSESTQAYTLSVLPAQPQSTDGNLPIVIDMTTPDEGVGVSKPPPGAIPRSGGRTSHVRALDFQKFHTPRKDTTVVGSPRTYGSKKPPGSAPKSSKTLFSNSKTVKPMNEPWDSKFRACLAKKSTLETFEHGLHPKREDKNSSHSAKSEQKTSSPNENFDSSNTKAKITMGRKGKINKAQENKNQANKIDNKTQDNKTYDPVFLNKTKEQLVKHLPADYRHSEMISQQNFTLTNLNVPVNYRKKCNIDNMREVKVVIPKDVKIDELIAENDKVVLSPSKLNSSKRSLMEEVIAPLVTPESNKFKVEPTVVPSTSTSRNITPYLQTPGKFVDMCPKTPSIYNPSVEETPMTKMFNEHTAGVDIAGIPTPNVLLTPSFPLTPLMNAHGTPYNPPTDYSTSSSYYQPSDNEQSKSIDTMIKECARLESERSVAGDDTIVEVDKNAVDKAVVEKMKSMKSNTIAKKNLSLIKKKDTRLSSSSEDSSCSSCSSSDDDYEEQETVVIETAISSRYALRSRTSPKVMTTTKDESVKKTQEARKKSLTPQRSSKEDDENILKPNVLPVPLDDNIVKKEVAKEKKSLAEVKERKCQGKEVKSKKDSVTSQKEEVKSQKEESKLQKEASKPLKVENKPPKEEGKPQKVENKPQNEESKSQKEIKSRPLSKEPTKRPSKDVKSSKEDLSDSKPKKNEPEQKPRAVIPKKQKYDEVKFTKSNISEIVTSVPFKPELNRATVPEDKNKKLLSDLEIKRKRMVDACKNENESKAAKRMPRLPPKKRRTSVRVLRSTNPTNSKFKEDDFHLSSSDEDTSETKSVRPFEVVETELDCSNSNPALSNITLRVSDDADECAALDQISLKVKDDSEGKQDVDRPEKGFFGLNCAAENLILQNEMEKNDDRTQKDGAKKKDTKSQSCSQGTIKDEKSLKKGGKLQETTEKAKEPIKKPPKKADRKKLDVKQKDPEEAKEKGIKCEGRPVDKEVSQERKKLPTEKYSTPEDLKQKTNEETKELKQKPPKGKGTTEEEAKTELMIGMEKMGFPVIAVDQTWEESNDGTDIKPKLQTTPPENIAHCYKLVNSSKDELFNISLHSCCDVITVDGTNSTMSKSPRNVDEVRTRLSKAYKMRIYSEEIDGEVEKELRVTTFVDLFSFDPNHIQQKRKKIDAKEKVKVLDHIVIKEKGEETLEDISGCSQKEITTDSTSDKKRKLKSLISEDEGRKKLKLDDQRLLQRVNVDDFLQNLHG